MKKISPLFFHVPLISLLLSFFVILFGNIGFIERISNGVNDVFTYKIRFQNNLHADNIVIVKIDDRTLDSLGRSDIGMSNFDKGTYADLIKNIFDHYDAEVVGVDVVFANASRL